MRMFHVLEHARVASPLSFLRGCVRSSHVNMMCRRGRVVPWYRHRLLKRWLSGPVLGL
jgi:hypothetical protein